MIPKELLPIMNVTEESVVTWIPFHMVHVLQSCRPKLSFALQLCVGTIIDLLQGFETGKTGSGDSWEGVWGVALIIRVLTHQQHPLLPIQALRHCTVSYNQHWRQPETSPPFPDVQQVSDFVAGLQAPPEFPHVAIYYPPHASFATYDLIVAFWDNDRNRHLYGYQLKEGREIPSSHGAEAFEQSYAIRGTAAKRGNAVRGWIVASDDGVDSFLGDSGKHLAPKHWRHP